MAIETPMSEAMRLSRALQDDPTEVNLEAMRRSLRGPVRLRTLSTLRWLAVAGQTFAVSMVHFGLGYPLPLGLCLAVIALSAWLNLFAFLRFSNSHYMTDREAAAYVAFDILQLCALLALTGGLANPFAVLILAPVTIAAGVLPMRLTALIVAVAFVGVSFVALLHFPLPWRVDTAFEIPRLYIVGIWSALTLSLGFFAIYSHRIAAEGGQMKSALAATQLALAREERLAAIGGLAAAAAHELGTPLATIQVTAKEMADELGTWSGGDVGPLREDADLLFGQAKRCQRILQRLSRQDVSGHEILEQVAIDLLVEQASQPFFDVPGGPEIAIEPLPVKDAGEAPIVRRLPEIIYGLRNVIENASIFAKSRVLIRISWSDTDICVFIQDDGPGFSPEVMARLGEPYISARMRSRAPSGRKGGLGLGFFIAKTLLERTGAEISFANKAWPDPAAGVGQRGAWVCVRWLRARIEVT